MTDPTINQPPAAPPVAPPVTPPAATFSQADLDKATNAAAAKAKKEHEAAISEYLAGQKAEADKATMTEVDRAKAEAAEARAEADVLKREAQAERVTAKVERLLSQAGVPAETLARAVKAAGMGPDATDDEINAEVEALKKEAPGMFITVGAGPVKQTSGYTAPKPPAAPGTATAKDIAQAELARRGYAKTATGA